MAEYTKQKLLRFPGNLQEMNSNLRLDISRKIKLGRLTKQTVNDQGTCLSLAAVNLI